MTPTKLEPAKTAQDRGIACVKMATEEMLKVSLKDITGRNRSAKVARARHIAIHVCRQMTGASFPALARAFGKANHNTPRHSCKVALDKIAQDSGFGFDVEAVQARAAGLLKGCSR